MELLPYTTRADRAQIKQGSIRLYPRWVQQQWLVERVKDTILAWTGQYQPTYQELADKLNELRITPPRGGQWNKQKLYNGMGYHGVFIGEISPLEPRPHTAAARKR